MESLISFNGVKIIKKNGKYSAFVSSEIGTDKGNHLECDTMDEIAEEINKSLLESIHNASEDVLLFIMHKYKPQSNAVLDLLGGLQEGEENKKRVRKFLEDVLIEEFGVYGVTNFIKKVIEEYPAMNNNIMLG